MIPGDGFLPAMVPASFDAWIKCFSRFGTMTLSQVAEPAVRLAEDGFPVYNRLQRNIRQHAERYSKEWPTTAQLGLFRRVRDKGRGHSSRGLCWLYRTQMWAMESRSGIPATAPIA